jgi:beta-galactosidase
LEKKYGSLKALGNAWHRYSYTSWDQVMAPRFNGQFSECLDWRLFKKQNYYELYQWKVNILRSVDPDAHITAHGVAGSLDYTYGDGNDDWLAASQVESYGMTWVMGRKGTEPWKQWQALDLVRCASREKTFWHAEMQGGPLWLQPQVLGREVQDGRITSAEDIRLWNLVSLSGGARGVLYLRWRSLLDGPLTGSFGLYSNDGSPNDRSRMSAQIAQWANSEKASGLMRSRPVKAAVGILIIDQIQEFNRSLSQAGEGKFYSKCQWGAYRMFFDSHIQVDFVHLDDIDQYKCLYFAYPIQLDKTQALKIAQWVKTGGTLLCEGLPGYFGDGCTAGTLQPNNGLDLVFGATEKTVEFMPDLGDRIQMNCGEIQNIPGGLFRQSYCPGSAQVLGEYLDHEPAILKNSYGEGTAYLIGTFPSEGYFRTSSPAIRELLENLLGRMILDEQVQFTGEGIQVRLSTYGNERFLWILNHSEKSQEAQVWIENFKGIQSTLWGESALEEADHIRASISGKNALIVQLA